jgi:AcrR family transcriptional regulator
VTTLNQPPSIPKRADAERNRERILTAAGAAFAETHAEISMAEISRRAGVGMATLYRNFASRRELLESLYADEVDVICNAAVSVEGETPGEVLINWLQQFFAFASHKRHVALELLADAEGTSPVFGESRARGLAAGQPLFDAAQQSCEIRDDLTLEQILDMIVAIATINSDSRYTEPILQTALDGLRL